MLKKASHCTDNVDDKDVFHNDLHKPTRNVGKDTLETQEEEEAGEESSDQESRPDDTDTGYISRVMDMVTGTSEIVRLRQDYCREHDELLFTGDVKGRESALRMLIDATTDERCGTLNHHSFNIAGHCLWFLGYSDMARLMFMKSAEITSNTEAEEENSCYHYFRLLDI